MIDVDAIRDQLLYHPAMQKAIAEMKVFILEHFPEATFSAHVRDEPFGVYLTTTVDVDDTDDVVDLVIDRVIDLQIAGIPLHVLPARTPERQAKVLAEQAAMAPGAVLD